jgi:hypothetical protein
MNIILTLLPLLVLFVMLAHVFVQLMSRHPDKYARLYSTCLSTGPFLFPCGPRRMVHMPDPRDQA